MRILTRPTALLILLWMSSVACGRKKPSLEEMQQLQRQELASIVREHQAAAKSMLAALRAAAADAKAAPAVVVREPLPAPVPVVKDDCEAAGVLLANVEWLAHDRWVNDAKVQLWPELKLEKLDKLLATGLFEMSGSVDAASVERSLTALAALQYVAVVRLREYLPPRLGSDARFAGGAATGDVIVFALPSRTRAGAFPFAARQRDTAHIRKGARAEQELEASFASDVKDAIRGELVAFLAGKPGPATPGVAAGAETAGFRDRLKLELTLAMVMGIVDVELAAGEQGPLVTIRAESPATLAPRGNVREDVRAIVTKVLGRDAEIRVVAAPPR